MERINQVSTTPDRVRLTEKTKLFVVIHCSLIARGNIERLEVVNKKWVRVIPVPGTATTTVSQIKFIFIKLELYFETLISENDLV